MAEKLADDLETAVLQINLALESVIRQCPSQYLWGYARFKQPRHEVLH
jgi:KDO2-lipid IV(A) lauroyltransferase